MLNWKNNLIGLRTGTGNIATVVEGYSSEDFKAPDVVGESAGAIPEDAVPDEPGPTGVGNRDIYRLCAISMAMGMGEKGVLHTIDINDEIEDFTRNYIEPADWPDRSFFISEMPVR